MLKTLLFFLLNFGLMFSQSYIPYSYHLNKKSGLPSEVIYDIYQDKKGFIWISSELGLCRFNGVNYDVYSLDSQTSKSGSNIVEDDFGRIWYSNFDGYIYYVEQGQLKFFKNHAPVGYHKFGIIKNSLFAIEENKVCVFNIITGKKIKSYKVNFGVLNNVHSDGKNFYVLSDALYIFNNSGMKKIAISDEIKNFMGIVIQNTKKGLLLTSKFEKFGYLYQSGRFKKVQFSEDITFVQNSCFDGSENWLCSTNGVYRLSSGNIFFKGYNISNVFKDRENNYWFTTLNDGIYLVPNINFEYIELDNRITSLSTYKDQLLIGTDDEKVFLKNFENTSQKTIFNGGRRHEIYMLKTFKGNPYIYTSSYNFNIFDENGKLIFTDASAVKDIVPVNKHIYAYALSGSCGVINLASPKDNKLFFNHAKILLPGIRGKSVVYDSVSDNIYFATNKGAFVSGKFGIKAVLYKKAPVYIQQLTIYKNRIFAVLQNQELFEICQDKAYPSFLSDKFKGLKIFKAKTIGDQMYFKTDFGIYVYDFLSKEFFKMLSYNQDLEYSQLEEVNGKIYISINRGLLSLPKNYHEKSKKTPFILEQVLMNGNVFDPNENHFFANNQNNLEIKYALLNFIPGSNERVYYKINDGAWQLIDLKSRKLELPSLSAGEYKIFLKTDDYENQPLIIQFRIRQIFWKNPLFILFFSIVILGAVVVYYNDKIKKINKHKKLELEHINLQKESNASKLKAFKSQMNPHFFYNALNTLQSYILTNEKKPALSYLSKFSGLTRKILEFTEQDNISVKEECDILNLYLELEKARFNNELNYHISLKNIFEPQNVFMPVMLLQPYVENALKHGLLHSKNQKTLNIIFEMHKDILCITIEDNGIGREKSSRINEQKGKAKPKSFATSAQNKRIDILNKIYKNNISISIKDRLNDYKQINGTIVKICLIPIKADHESNHS